MSALHYENPNKTTFDTRVNKKTQFVSYDTQGELFMDNQIDNANWSEAIHENNIENIFVGQRVKLMDSVNPWFDNLEKNTPHTIFGSRHAININENKHVYQNDKYTEQNILLNDPVDVYYNSSDSDFKKIFNLVLSALIIFIIIYLIYINQNEMIF